MGQPIASLGQPIRGSGVRTRSLSPEAGHFSTYNPYHGTTVDHEHTVSPPKITFGRSTGPSVIQTALPDTRVRTSNVNVVPRYTNTTYVQEEPRVIRTSGVRYEEPRPVAPRVNYQPPQQSVYVPPPPQPQYVPQPQPQYVPPQEPVRHEPPPVQPVQHTTYQQPYRPEKKDEFLCSKACWAIAAIIGLILLTLALLWGLGVFGGSDEKSNKAPYWGTDNNLNTDDRKPDST